jgi:SH3-like domain-containing protein
MTIRGQSTVRGHRWGVLLLTAILALGTTAPALAQSYPPGVTKGPVSGLPLPRYVSLKSDRVHVRQGPGLDYKVLWVFQRVGLPVEVIREYESWREIRDSEGATGWVLQSLLSGRRSGLVVQWDSKRGKEAGQRLAIHAGQRESSEAVAMVEPGVIANLLSCEGRWCHVAVGPVKGYIQRKSLWGVYENETLR